MALLDRPDFWDWLKKVEAVHDELTQGRPATKRRECCRCGAQLSAAFDSSTGECLVCLAERFGREQAEDAAYVARTLMLAVLAAPNTPPDVIRAAIEDVMDDYELIAAARAEAAAARA